MYLVKLLSQFCFKGFAEKAGFEPAIRFWRIHAFQACLFNHSSISPSKEIPFSSKTGAKYEKFIIYKSFLK